MEFSYYMAGLTYPAYYCQRTPYTLARSLITRPDVTKYIPIRCGCTRVERGTQAIRSRAVK